MSTNDEAPDPPQEVLQRKAIDEEVARHNEAMRNLITDYRIKRHPLQETYDVGMDLARDAHRRLREAADIDFRQRRDELAAALSNAVNPLDRDFNDEAASLLARHTNILRNIRDAFSSRPGQTEHGAP